MSKRHIPLNNLYSSSGQPFPDGCLEDSAKFVGIAEICPQNRDMAMRHHSLSPENQVRLRRKGNRMKKQIIGIASDPQEKNWIQKFQHERQADADVEIVFEGLLIRRKILEFMKDTGLLDRVIDGFVLHTMNYDDETFNELKSALASRGLLLFSTTGETSRPSWRAR